MRAKRGRRHFRLNRGGSRAPGAARRTRRNVWESGGNASVPFSPRTHGFTLVELTVVISIIATLAAILFPVFARAREKARQTGCMTNLQQIGLALSMYARDHAGHFPPTNDDLTPLLGRYLPMDEALHCPSAGEWEHEKGAAAAERYPMVVDPVPEFDYYYRAGFCDDDDPNTLLVCDTNLNRHNGGANALFADGHTRWQKDPRDGGSGSGRTGNALPVIIKERHLKERLERAVEDPGGPGL
jgi:prepilin-type processing-associated H-X9-DG protein/prepilin-type N-terminal cleavage/methylation domain-containing protein